jgi:hypothetical protein
LGLCTTDFDWCEDQKTGHPWPDFSRSFVRTFGKVNQKTAASTNFDTDQRRAGIRRTAWIVGGIALAMFVLFFLKQGIWH